MCKWGYATEAVTFIIATFIAPLTTTSAHMICTESFSL